MRRRPSLRAPISALVTLALGFASIAPFPSAAPAQANSTFNVNLSIDYSSAGQMLELLRGDYVSTQRLSGLRGNRIAASTSELIAGRADSPALLRSYLDSLQAGQIIRDDIYGLEDARRNADTIAALLDELQRRNINRKVVATVEQLFPGDIPVSAVIPVYVVAFGHENADAYVRRIIWKEDTPEFVGEGEGELTIIINLAAAAEYRVRPESRLSSILVTVAHELFHAAFGLYKDASPFWRRYQAGHTTAADALLDLVQNEGIAYYVSMEQRMGDRLPDEWSRRMAESFATFNRNAERLLSGKATGRETADILHSANLSGYWESYGSMAGMAMAREVDRGLGRQALIETLSLGPLDLFRKYIALTGLNSGLPKISPRLVRHYALE